MKHYPFEAAAGVEHDVESAFDWYESEEPGLGSEFLEQLRATYQRIIDNPLGYQQQPGGIRRALRGFQSLLATLLLTAFRAERYR
ncbi:MAG TPA: hypothetical protein VIW64_17620 [Pyrinomonadaceae bacterium]